MALETRDLLLELASANQQVFNLAALGLNDRFKSSDLLILLLTVCLMLHCLLAKLLQP